MSQHSLHFGKAVITLYADISRLKLCCTDRAYTHTQNKGETWLLLFMSWKAVDMNFAVTLVSKYDQCIVIYL